MNIDFLILHLNKIVNYYYNIFGFDSNVFKNSGEMSTTKEEQKENMAFFKTASTAFSDCFR